MNGASEEFKQAKIMADRLHSIIFNAWEQGELSDKHLEELTEALGRNNYVRPWICTFVAAKLTEDLKLERHMMLKRGGARA